MNILETKQLTFKYKKELILNHLELSIPQGSIYGYLGKNGSGKTTTIKLLLGLLKAPDDSVYYGGREFRHNRESILNGIGSLIEYPCFYGDLTGSENLKYLDYIYHCGQKRIDTVLELAGLTKARNKKVKKYSTGMKQRLGIAMAILHNPDFLILDEPLNGLDPQGIYDTRDLILRLRGEGKTILLSSHVLNEIEKICTHVGILDNGSLLYQGCIQELLSGIEREILIKLNNPPEAEKLCSANSITSEAISGNLLLVRVENERKYAALIQLLISNNIDIYSIEPKENSLESIFLKLINNN